MIDLFAGTGAFSLAFENNGSVECVFANDYDKSSKIIYDENFSHKLTLKDLNDIELNEIPDHDILTAGFPCQPFSIAGKQKGFNNSKSNIFWKILEIMDHHKPNYVILENVKNLTSHDNKKTFEIIKNELTNRGYFITYKILNTSEITGIPQNRERIYIVCIKSKEIHDKFSLDFENIEKKQIIEMLDNDILDKYYYTEKSKTWNLVKENIVKQNTIYQYRRVKIKVLNALL
jgi:DNA (cytosine-5)-methyltransferase 1